MKSTPSKTFHFLQIAILIAALFGSAVTVSPVRAASIIVNSDADTVADDGACTLREAITAANTDTASGAALGECDAGSGADTISFASNYTITLGGTQLPLVTTQITINGNGSTNTDIRANANPDVATSRVFEVSASGNLTLSSLTVQNGHCAAMCATFPNDGGGIVNAGTLTIMFSALESNSTTQHGGGIYNTGTLIVNNSTVSSNTVSDAGGGIYNAGTMSIINSTFSHNKAGDGGGGFYSATGSVTISLSSFTDNSSYNGGGAISNEDTSIITMTNSTIANNTSTDNSGGGIRNAGTINIYNSTISGNSSSGGVYDGANIIQSDIGTPALNLYNTIIANSGGSDGDCSFYAGTVNAINTLIESTGSKACGLVNGANDNIIGSDPNLGPLANNGGTNVTHALQSGSPAINAGNNAICAAAPVNNQSQNGITRPSGSQCDIGAFEKNSIPTTPTFGDVPTSHTYYSDIEILYANGLTAGCSTNTLLYCPDMTMNRAQSAVFMVRGNFGNAYSPPAAPWTTFGDDFSPGPWAQPWAQGMFDAGLTAGCSTSPRLFCPWEEMPRFQAAVFGMRLKYGIAYPPPAGTGTVFADITDPTLWYAGWAEQAYAEGMLPACGSSGGKPLFCPNDLVSRGLAAYMIVRAKNLSMP